jgi:hypothetical protein
MKTIKKVIDKILNKYGYYKAEMPEGSAVSEKDILEMFQAYGTNEQFVLFLRDLCAQDIRLHFQASTDRDRDTIRGAHQRTNFFISLIRKSNDKRKSGNGRKD